MAPVQHRFDGADQPALDLEDFGDGPGPRDLGAAFDCPAVRQGAEARFAAGVVEEREREREPTLGVDEHEPPVTNARHVEEDAALELLEAADLRAARPALGARAHERDVTGEHEAVLEPRAVRGER